MSDLRNYLYLDIETIGAPTPEMVEEITASITVPASYKKPETIAEWEQNTKPELVKEALAKTALNGVAGQIVCIGWAWGNEAAATAVYNDLSLGALEFGGFERCLLSEALARIDRGKPSGYERPIIVGHNVAGFDIRFLWQRAFVLGVKMPAWFPRDPKPWADSVHDTMQMWGGRDWIGLDALCRAMGLPGKGNITGADVGRLWESGEYDAIAEYCRADVERVRAVHRKMLVSYGEVPAKQAYA